MRKLDHDAVNQETLYRETISHPGFLEACRTCGQYAKRNRLFRYYVQKDGINTPLRPVPGVYCSKKCMEQGT